MKKLTLWEIQTILMLPDTEIVLFVNAPNSKFPHLWIKTTDGKRVWHEPIGPLY